MCVYMCVCLYVHVSMYVAMCGLVDGNVHVCICI